MSNSKKTIPPLPALEEVLAYEFEDIEHKFIEFWDISLEESGEIFSELKKWLWLMSAHYHDRKGGDTPPPPVIPASLYMLDQMWHQFMLYTHIYERFSKDFFGYFIGHSPLSRAMQLEMDAAWEKDPDGEKAKADQEVQDFKSYVSKKLGDETAEKWFVTWKERFCSENLNAMRKPIVLAPY